MFRGENESDGWRCKKKHETADGLKSDNGLGPLYSYYYTYPLLTNYF